uniref:Protein singed wings 2-like n=1 Tax=Hirondellea gigas TaxID=1518452 RepID=A0A6A7G0F6_9CRUS
MLLVIGLFYIFVQACICEAFAVSRSSSRNYSGRRRYSLSTATQLRVNDSCVQNTSSASEGEYSCIGLLSPSSLSKLPPSVVNLTITRSNLTALHSSHLQHLTNLHRLSIRDSLLVMRNDTWGTSPEISVISLDGCWSNLPDDRHSNAPMNTRSDRPHLVLIPKVWSGMDSLRRLELSKCNVIVRDAEVGFSALPPNCKLVFTEGSLECQSSHDYLLGMVEAGRADVSKNITCFTLGDISMFNTYYTFNDKPLLDVLKLRKSMELCPSKCSCVLLGIRSMDRPLLSVNCTNAGLTRLPDRIPPLASTLVMSNNKLSNMDALFSNRHYSRLANCDFSDNFISNINGTALVSYISSRSHDIKFVLRNNNLTTFPVWELSSFYSRSHRSGKKHLPAFELSGNPWDCHNCSFSPYFKTFVYDNMFHIKDYAEVRCDNTGERIFHTDFDRQCNPPPSLLLPIDVLNIFMALVLSLLLADFAYNFYQYRTHGKLPWIVRHCKIC